MFPRAKISFLRGFSTFKTIEGLDPSTEYTFRLCVIGTNNERSEYSQPVTIRTTSIYLFLIFSQKNIFYFNKYNI